MRTEFITGLGLQFCGFDGFRWGESGLSPKVLPSFKTNKTTKPRCQQERHCVFWSADPIVVNHLPAPIRNRDSATHLRQSTTVASCLQSYSNLSKVKFEGGNIRQP